MVTLLKSKVLVFKPGVYESMIYHLRSDMMVERCGLLVGNGDVNSCVVEEFIPIRNVSESPDLFTMDALEMNQAFSGMDIKKLSLVGIVHSHRSGHPEPSNIDLDQWQLNVPYVIVTALDAIAYVTIDSHGARGFKAISVIREPKMDKINSSSGKNQLKFELEMTDVSLRTILELIIAGMAGNHSGIVRSMFNSRVDDVISDGGITTTVTSGSFGNIPPLVNKVPVDKVPLHEHTYKWLRTEGKGASQSYMYECTFQGCDAHVVMNGKLVSEDKKEGESNGQTPSNP